MPCDDCPGEELTIPRPARGARNYIVYTGEGYAAFYRLAGSMIPEGELRHGRPVVRNDGSLEYPAEPDLGSGPVDPAGPAPAAVRCKEV